MVSKLFGGIEINNFDHGEAIAGVASNGFNRAVDQCVSRSTPEGNLLGGVIYQNYVAGGSITLHVASWHPRWLTHDLLWAIFAYPFVQLKVQKCLGFVPSTNEHALKFDLKIGFHEEHRIRDAVPGGDLVVLSMRKEQCRWLTGPPPKGFLKAEPPSSRPSWQEIYA